MADVGMGAKVNSDVQPKCSSDDINMNCASCISVKEQLHNALLELTSARSIIALLQEDINKINAPEVTTITNPTQCRESSVCDQVNRNLIPVIHSCSKKTKKPAISLTTRHNRQFVTPSTKYTLLSNVQDSAVLKSSDNQHKPRVHYKEFNVRDIGHNAENTDSGKCESGCYYTSLDNDKPRISDEAVILKALLGIHDAHSNINKPGKWLNSNMSSPSPRCHSASEFENHHTFTRKRSVSSTSMTPRRNIPPEESIKTEHVTGFQRSLKLLGLQPRDFGINDEVSTSKSRKPSSRIGPTFFTRLRNRSSSLENLKSLMQAHIHDGQRTFGDHVDRELLSSAVYEVWYFQKLDEARRNKKAEILNDQRKKEDFEKAKTDQKRKAEENFSEWKQLKNKQRQQWKQQQEEKKKLENETGGDYRLTGGTREKSNQEAAILLWKREKDKLLKQKKIEQKIQKEKLKSGNEKKATAEMNYKVWKKRADETMREKAQKEERRRQQEEESKKENEKLKQERAESSFRAWKKKKDSEIKNKLKENKLAEEEKKAIKLMQEAERMYAAEQVFEEWLDQVDRRQNKLIDEVHKQKQRIQHQFPWSPGGSVH